MSLFNNELLSVHDGANWGKSDVGENNYNLFVPATGQPDENVGQDSHVQMGLF